MIHIYKASAGSGKTFTLAREYIKLLLGVKTDGGTYRLRRKEEKPHHDAILAITFTNKATEEMKERIIHELAVLAGLEKGWTDPSPYLADLCAELHCSPSQLAEMAGVAVRELLYDFSRFNVSTIDSFFQLVLRSFAHEAEVSGSYDLELDDKTVIGQSVDTLLQDLNHDASTDEQRNLVAWITSYMTKLINDGVAFNIFNRASEVHSRLIEFFADITDDTYRDNEDALLEYLRDPELFTSFRTSLEKRIDDLKEATAGPCRAAVTAMKSVTPSDGGICKGILNNNVAGPIHRWAEHGYYTGSGNEKYAFPSDTLRKAQANIDDAYVKDARTSVHRPVLDPAVEAALTAIVDGASAINLLRIIQSNIYQLGLLSVVARYLMQYRIDNSTILLSDTNSLLTRVIGDDNTSFVYEKVGTRFRNYLIDEFQDTSYSQWRNLKPLVDESLSEDKDNLVIGDGKQCIYRFRGSDPSLLGSLHTTLPEGRVEVKGEKISENTNWRSAANVVRFNNTLFTEMARATGFGDSYRGVVQQISPKRAKANGGYVDMLMVPRAARNSGDDSDTQAALDHLTAHLRRQLEAGYRPGDIAILVRRWKEGARVVEHLEQVKEDDPTFPRFNIVSDRSLLISRSPAVMLIVSRLRYLSSIDYTPGPRSISRRELALVLNDFESLYASSASASQALSGAVERMKARAEASPEAAPAPAAPDEPLAVLDLITLVETIAATIVPKDSLQSEGVFITAFQDLVLDFAQRNQGDIRSFLAWWDELGSKMSVSGADDPMAINILTIHKSKGLEFPCVHVPFAGFGSDSHTSRAWFRLSELEGFDPAVVPPLIPLDISRAMSTTPLAGRYDTIQRERLLDMLNLLYVAMTRAGEELIVTAAVPKPDGKKKAKKTGEASELPTLEEALVQAVEMSTTAEVSRLEADVDIPDGSLSPFIPLAADGEGRVTVGAPTVPGAKEAKPKSALKPTKGEMHTDYRVGATSSPWRGTRLDPEVTLRFDVARERGILIHEVLSHVTTPDTVGQAMRLASASSEWRTVTPAERAEILDIVQRRVTSPEAAQWFVDYTRLLREREVKTVAGVTKRFDRVVWTSSGEIHLVDYKTGSQPPKKYFSTIREYVDFFHTAGYPAVRAFLYYLDSGAIEEIQ